MADKTQQAELHYRRGMVLEQAGRIAEAVEQYRQALQDNPRLRAAHIALANYYARNGLLARAADELVDVVALGADYESLSQLASAQIELKRYQEARATLQACLRLVPDDPFTAYELAYIEYAEGNYQAARDQLVELRPIYNDEWQLHHLLGNCQIKLGQYDVALASFGRAMMLTDHDDHLEELQASVAMIERLREFTTLEQRKDRAYTEHGVICLGTAGDDGIHISDPPESAWTYPAIAVTLRRALDLAAAGVWRCSAVLPLNRAAEPMARVLAHDLGRPLCQLDAVQPDDIVLVVAGIVAESALLLAIHERVPCPVVMFALTLRTEPGPGDTLPDLIGLFATQASLPWEAELSQLRQTGAPLPAINALLDGATAQIGQAFASLETEPTAAAQVEYYRTQHRLLDLP